MIGSKWVFALKHDEHGNITRFKARSVALGFLLTFGVDYSETYSPVASLATVRALLAVSCQLGYHIKQYDIETAFLKGNLDETVFMKVSYGIKYGEGMVCRLRKRLYGLKQAAAVWYKTICDVLLKAGFRQCRADPCLFVPDGRSGLVFVIWYVDDLLVGCADVIEAEHVESILAAHFKVKAYGDTRLILKMEVQYNRKEGRLILKQEQFVSRMVKTVGQEDAFAVRNTNVAGQNFHAVESDSSNRLNKPYRELIGSLLYVANGTRPDVCVSTSLLSHFLENQQAVHWRATISVLRYLTGTAKVGILFRRTSEMTATITGISNANWGRHRHETIHIWNFDQSCSGFSHF
ncbi:polyprotein [Phytophthora megakarya]|uniref:Polyprotein n=1 Tax=Phytophthora megakarya TaxID=4795 RepID=A0A225V7J9_9STRA|nr:polyprotein [Phytophthora megakarya]